MASHVLVVDSRARQARIATTPATHLSDVLQQGCQKLGLDATLFVLKYNDKIVDLSRPIRQAGLPSGAQLQLVQGSRSPTVITVAVQIPHIDSTRRVTERVPSSHSIWQILRLVETKQRLNFTQRGVGNFDLSNVSSGSGRMCYEMPVVNITHRDLSTFADLQKSLAQLGVTSGNVLMRLSFKVTTQPLEEAMTEISQYFKDNTTEQELPKEGPAAVETNSQPLSASVPAVASQSASTAATPVASALTEQTALHSPADAVPVNDEGVSSPRSSVTVYSAPTTNPTSRVVYNEADYIPTTEHAAVHQARLQQSSRNTRLLSDAELAAKAKQQEAKVAAVNNVEVRIRFPDLTQIKSDFARGSTAHDVYELVRSQMHKPQLKFALRYVDSKGSHVILADDAKLGIIENAGWRGRVLANMEWDASVSSSDRQGQILASEALKQAQELPVPVETRGSDKTDEQKGNFLGNLLKKDGGSKSDMTGAEKEDKLKKFLRFGKK